MKNLQTYLLPVRYVFTCPQAANSNRNIKKDILTGIAASLVMLSLIAVIIFVGIPRELHRQAVARSIDCSRGYYSAEICAESARRIERAQ